MSRSYTHVRASNQLAVAKGVNDSTITLTGITTDDAVNNVWAAHIDTDGTIPTVTDLSSSVAITANTLTFSGSSYDSDWLFLVYWHDDDA
jgi:hypothetical protein